MTNRIDIALKQEAQRRSIIPTGKNKRPLITSWKQYQKTPATREKIIEWWTRWPDANPAMITGEISDVVVLDVDMLPSGELATHKSVPITATSRTGSGGRHFIFKHPGFKVKNSARKIAPGIDVRGDAGYILLPVSENEKGMYEWVVSPEEGGFAEMPKWLIEAVSESKKISHTIKDEFTGVVEGSRNETMASIAGEIINRYDPEIVNKIGWKEFVLKNQLNDPPLEDDELSTIWSSILNRHRVHEEKMSTQRENGAGIRSISNTKEMVFATCNYLCAKHNFKTPDTKGRELYLYRGGYYQESENFVRQEIQKILKDKSSKAIKSEILESIKDRTLVDEDKLVLPKDLINVSNGVYSFSKKELLGHSPEYFFKWKLPIDYKEDATCHEILKALRTVLTEDDIGLLQEWLGYCLYRDYGMKKAVIMVGEQNTGKTTVLRLFEALIGKENMAGVSLDKLTSNNFALAHLRDKLINIYDDLSYKDINDNGVFKMVTGNGTVTGEFKYGHQFHFQNYAKLTFSCNKIPSVKDTNDDAYFGRWIVLEFNRQIEKPDPYLFARITTDEELSGLFNFALVGLERVLKNKKFTYLKTEDEIKEQMLKSGSPVAQFAYDCLEERRNGIVVKDVMIDHYRAYAKNNGLPQLTKETLGRKLPKYAPYIDSGKEGRQGRQYSVWQNVSTKESCPYPES